MIDPKLLAFANDLQDKLTPVYNKLADIQEQVRADLQDFPMEGPGNAPDSPEATQVRDMYEELDRAVVALARAYMLVSDTVQSDTPGSRELVTSTNALETPDM